MTVSVTARHPPLQRETISVVGQPTPIIIQSGGRPVMSYWYSNAPELFFEIHP